MNGNFGPGDELIIVNDASTDSTQQVIDEQREKYDGIVGLQHLINRGSAAAGRNTAIERARTELIFCLDADNILAPNSVSTLKAHLLRTGADVAAFGELHYFADAPQKVTHKWVYKEGVITLSDALSGNIWPGPSGNYMLTKESWLRAGRYDEFIGGAYDSWAFGIQQLATGSRMVTLKETFYYHRYGHESTFVRASQKTTASLVALRVLLPFLGLIKDEDVEYIMSREGRYTWFQHLQDHPIRLKHTGAGYGKSGTVVVKPRSLAERIVSRARRLFRSLYGRV
jgi:glycosyltransferase involved in cell wall biosynthesis